MPIQKKGTGRQPHHSPNWGGARNNCKGGQPGTRAKYSKAAAIKHAGDRERIIERLAALALNDEVPLAIWVGAAKEVLPYIAGKISVSEMPSTDEMDYLTQEQKVDRINHLLHVIQRKQPKAFSQPALLENGHDV